MKAAVRLMLVLALLAPSFASAQGTAPQPTCRLSASATTVNPNTRVRLDWTSTNTTSGYLNGVGVVAPNGFTYVVPGKNTTYTASFTGAGGTAVCTVGIAVANQGVPITGAPVSTGGGTQQNTPVVTPAPAPAQSGGGFTGGIVPAECRGASTVANCDICSLAQLGQNVANFLIGLFIPAAALLFAWAGFRYFSSRGNPILIQKAHETFRKVGIALLVAVGAWVLVMTVMNMLVHQGSMGSWDWRSLNCTETRKARLYNMNLKDYLNSSIPGLTSYTPPVNTSRGGCLAGDELTVEGFCIGSGGGVYSSGSVIDTSRNSGATSCPSGYAYTAEEGGYCQSTDPTTPDAWTEACPQGYVFTPEEGGYCVDPNNPNRWVEQDGTGGSGGQTSASRSARSAEFNNQISAACSQLGISCDIAGRIGINESSGGRNCTTSSTGAAGCMQVLATTACGVDSSISSACAACSASRQSLSPQCAPVIETIVNNQQLGVNLGVQYIYNLQNMPALQEYRSAYGDCEITAAAYYAGPGAVRQAGGIISNIRVPAGAPSAAQYVATACR